MTSPDSIYAKPFMTVPEQIRRLRDRGMGCGTDVYASGILERYGYYRLSGYSHLYRARPMHPDPKFDGNGREIRLDSFVKGTSLSHVVALHDFDHELRTRLGEVVSAIELSFRFFIGHRLGRVDKFAHRNPETLDALRETEPGDPVEPTTAYREWLEEYDRHEKRARDNFVLHFRLKYGPNLPIWVATEVMSFGVLSSLYTLMPQVDQEILAARFQVYTADGAGDRGALANWLNNLRNVRNICAHYGRVWNRTFDVLIDAPGHSREDTDSHLFRLVDKGVNNKLYGVLIVMRHLLLSIAPDRTDVVDIANLIHEQSQTVGFNLRQLGFPDDWGTDPIWDQSFALDHAPMMAASLLDRTEIFTAVDARAALFGAEAKASEHPRTAAEEVRAKKAAQRRLLKSYRDYDVVIEVELGGAKYYPSFQFRHGKIIEPLAEINRAFAAKCVEVHSVHVAAAQLDWWQTPHPALPESAEGSAQSPRDLLASVSEMQFSKVIEQSDAMGRFAVPEALSQSTTAED